MAESAWNEAVILDPDHLRGFTGGDSELEAHVLKIFADNAPGYLAALGDAGCENWRASAHKLKGAARSIGAWRLAREAERAELMGDSDTGGARREQVLAELAVRLTQLLQTIQKQTK